MLHWKVQADCDALYPRKVPNAGDKVGVMFLGHLKVRTDVNNTFTDFHLFSKVLGHCNAYISSCTQHCHSKYASSKLI